MNNIEKLAIEAGLYVDGGEIRVFPKRYNSISNLDISNTLEAFAKALQSSEPVAWRIKHEDDDEWDISCDKPITVGNYEVQPLFTIPPSTVPLEKYNKLLDALNIASKAIKYAKDNVSVADGKRAYHDDVSYYLDVLKAIAEAEVKEG